MTRRAWTTARNRTRVDQIYLVATNPAYAELCSSSVKRLRPGAKVTVLSFSTLGEVQLPRGRASATLIVSRLADLSGAMPPTPSIRGVTKQLVFLDTLPVEAVATHIFPLSIRNPERIHLATARDRHSMSALIYRVVSGLAEGHATERIADAWLERQTLVLLTPTFERLQVPFNQLARLLGSDSQQLGRFEIDEDGRFLYWPHADVHLGWTQFRQLLDPTIALTSAAESGPYHRRYGAAIRELRESRGLKQTDVPGITNRHLRRVEHGQQAASKGTLEALAKAHALSLAEYVDLLAQAASKVS